MSDTIIVRPDRIYSESSIQGTIDNPSYVYDQNDSTYAHLYNTMSNTATSTTTRYGVSATVFYNKYPMNIVIPDGAEIVGGTLHYDAYYTSGGTNIKKTGQTKKVNIGLCDKTGDPRVSGNVGTSRSKKTVSLTKSDIETWLNFNRPTIRCFGQYLASVNSTGAYTRTIDLYIYELYVEIEYQFPSTGLQCKVKVNGNWEEAEVLVKVNGEWVNPSDAFVKVNGVWEPIE